VGELDFAVTRELLTEHFCKYFSTIKNVNIILDTITKRSKGYGFVTLENEEDYRKAIEEVNGSTLNGR
jgi:nucleolar protein 4